MDARAKDAEISVIGGMLLDETAAASALEQLSRGWAMSLKHSCLMPLQSSLPYPAISTT